MDYFIYVLKKFIRSTAISTILIVFLWGTLYHLTDWVTVKNYFLAGLGVCVINTIVANLRKRKLDKIIHVELNWIVMAGMVLVLYHAGFAEVAVLVSAAFLASPFFGATIYESIVGATLLVTLAKMM